MNDMTQKIFEVRPYGKAALKKIGPVAENFRLFEASWLKDGVTMRVCGAEFREAKRGPNIGRLSIMVPNTTKTVYVTRSEIEKFGDL